MLKALWRKLLLTVLIACLLFLAGAPHVSAASSASRAQKLVMDCAKRRVLIPAMVDRIGCLYTFSGHCTAMLSRGDHIVAIANGLRRNDLFNRICPAVLTARVPKAQGAVNIEEVLRAAPQLLFVSGDMRHSQGLVARLDHFKIPFLVVDYHSIQGQQQAVNMIGEALSQSNRAARFNGYFNDCIRRVEAHISKIPPDKRPTLYHAVNEPLRTTVVNGLATDWLRAAGAINVAEISSGRALADKTSVAMEQILLWNPDVILANEPAAVDTIRHSRKWSYLKAVQTGQVLQMPIGISRWGHPGGIETPLAILWAAKKLYPHLFEDLDMIAETKAFYREFLNYRLTAKEVEMILSGKTHRSPKHMGPGKKTNSGKGRRHADSGFNR